MLMDNVRRDCVEEHAIMGPGCGVSENRQRVPPAPTQRRVFRAMSGGNLLAMPTHSGRLDKLAEGHDVAQAIKYGLRLDGSSNRSAG